MTTPNIFAPAAVNQIFQHSISSEKKVTSFIVIFERRFIIDTDCWNVLKEKLSYVVFRMQCLVPLNNTPIFKQRVNDISQCTKFKSISTKQYIYFEFPEYLKLYIRKEEKNSLT